MTQSTTPARPPARLRPAQWRAARAVLQAVCCEGRVADATLQHWFREHREMGGRDRALVSDLVYGVLRDAMRLQQIAGPIDGAEPLLALHVLDSGQLEVAALCDLGCADAEHWQARLLSFDTGSLSAAARANVPESIWNAWCGQYGAAETAALAAALNQEASVDLRVNTLKADRDRVLAALRAAGIEAEPGRLAATCVRLPRRVALNTLDCYRQGWIEPQDEGSQLLAAMVDAHAGQRIADYCAGAGGKTLAIAAAMAGLGELWALDIDAARLRRLSPRAERAGVANLHVRPLPDPEWLSQQASSFDAVLVDAPCSGTGTWRRNPELRLRALDLPALARQQLAILSKAARLLRPGGRLIYATCSLLAAENEEVIAAFLAEQPEFAPALEIPSGLERSPLAQGRLQLLPHRSGSDGFFAAALQRRR